MPSHRSTARKGVLLVNLGTPDAPTRPAVRRFLAAFLSDPRVITLPAYWRYALVYGLILPLRPYRVVHAYRAIWRPAGSPLRIESLALQQALQTALGQDYQVVLGMRYGQPSLQQAIMTLQAARLTHWSVLPLFPQYAAATTASVWDGLSRALQQTPIVPSIHFMGAFFNDHGYIQALKACIQPHWEAARPQCLLMSYHGLPTREVIKTDLPHTRCDRTGPCPRIRADNAFCYRAQCYATSRALAGALGLSEGQYAVSFQSRLGRLPWIPPYTDALLPQLIKKGIKRIMVVCPSFLTDCLETLEEIGIQARTQWHQLGGEQFDLVPCLNAHPAWVRALKTKIQQA